MKSSTLQTMAYTFGIFSFIGSIVLGFMYKVPAEYSFQEPTFNFGFMLAGFGSTFLIVVAMLTFSAILKNQERLLKGLEVSFQEMFKDKK